VGGAPAPPPRARVHIVEIVFERRLVTERYAVCSPCRSPVPTPSRISNSINVTDQLVTRNAAWPYKVPSIARSRCPLGLEQSGAAISFFSISARFRNYRMGSIVWGCEVLGVVDCRLLRRPPENGTSCECAQIRAIDLDVSLPDTMINYDCKTSTSGNSPCCERKSAKARRSSRSLLNMLPPFWRQPLLQCGEGKECRTPARSATQPLIPISAFCRLPIDIVAALPSMNQSPQKCVINSGWIR